MEAQMYTHYEETTADGYSVYVVTHDMNNVCVSEDVYYYESDIPSAIMEHDKHYSNGDIVLYMQINTF